MLLTQDGTHLLKPTKVGIGGGSMLIFISGNYGTADVLLQYVNGQGDMIALEDGALLNNTQNRVDMCDMPIYLQVSNSDASTAIDVLIRSIA